MSKDLTKIEALRSLVRRGLNVHKYIVPRSIDELDKFMLENTKCSVRYDSNTLQIKLPFYLIDSYNHEKVIECWKLKESTGLEIICANGHMYEDNLIYNMGVVVDRNGNFVLDACTERTALRLMYNTGKVMSVDGNLFGDIHRVNGVINVNRSRLLDKVFEVYENKLFNRLVEVSVYDKKVGMLNMDMVYWQI